MAFSRGAEQPRALPVAGNVDGAAGVAQAGHGQPAGRPGSLSRAADYGSVIRPEKVVSSAKRGASTHPGILKRRRGNSYLWDASRGLSCRRRA